VAIRTQSEAARVYSVSSTKSVYNPAETGFGELHGKRQTNVAQANHGNAGLSCVDFVK
jgi:hypothetical protein